MTTAQGGGKVVSLTHRPPLLPQEMFLVLISVTGWVDPRAIVRSEGFYVNEIFQWHQVGSNQQQIGMKTKRNLIVMCHKIIQVKHTNNPVCLLQMSEVTTMQFNYTDLKGKPSLKNQLIIIVFLLGCNSP